MNTNNKKVFVIASILVFAFLIYFATYFQRPVLETNETLTTESSEENLNLEDPIISLKQENELYKQGLDLNKAGKKEEALVKLNESKSLATNDADKANIDFSISLIESELDREGGVEKFYDLSQNDSYPERTRALAMIRTYLNYSKYKDETVLRKIADTYKIDWTNEEEVIYKFMQEIYKVDPFAFAKIKIIDYELNSITDKAEAAELYNTNRPEILDGIKDSRRWSGESTELTSSMLAHANLLSRLYIEFDKVTPLGIVEAAYQENIDYSNAHDHPVNKQYALLSYANFLSGVEEYSKATVMLQMITDEGVNRALKEAIPAMNVLIQYPYLPELAERTTSPTVRQLITSMGVKN